MDELTLSVIFWGGVLAALFAVVIIILLTMHFRALARIKLEEARLRAPDLDEIRAEMANMRQMMQQILLALDRPSAERSPLTNSGAQAEFNDQLPS